eukprot:80416_1
MTSLTKQEEEKGHTNTELMQLVVGDAETNANDLATQKWLMDNIIQPMDYYHEEIRNASNIRQYMNNYIECTLSNCYSLTKTANTLSTYNKYIEEQQLQQSSYDINNIYETVYENNTNLLNNFNHLLSRHSH